MKSAQKEELSITFTGQLYPSLVRRFEVLSGREFSSKVFSFSAYKAIGDMIDSSGVAGERLLPFLKDMLKKTVGGKVSSLSISKGTGGVVRLENCAEAKLHGPSEAGVCYIAAGIIEAVAERYIGQRVHVIERKCLSKGDAFCEFAVMPTGTDFAQGGQQETPQGLTDLVHG